MPEAKNDLTKKLRQAEKLIESQAETIERMRRSRLPAIPKGRQIRGKGAYVRVVIPDSHGCYAEPVAIAALLRDIEALAPREIVWLGDHLDCGGFLAQHHVTHYVAQSEYTFEDDAAHANDLLDRVHKAAPKAENHYLEGNHERRIETFICTATVRNVRDASFLRRMFGPETVLNLAKRRIPYYSVALQHFGLRVRGAIKLGHCYFVHGISAAKRAAGVHLDKFGCPVCFGHTHRVEVASGELVNSGVGMIQAWCPGCLCQRAPLYAHGNPLGWTHGYAVQLVAKDGTFLHLQVPIDEGRSYLVPFLDLVKAR